MMNQRERAALDRHITGNYGEDQLRESPLDSEDVAVHQCPWCNQRVTAVATDDRAIFVHSKGNARDRARNPLMCPKCFGVGAAEDFQPDPEPDICPPPDVTGETWHVNPRGYDSGNVYTVWNADDNYHDDLTPEAMDARARLMAQAPEMFRMLKEAYGWLRVVSNLRHALMSEDVKKIRRLTELTEAVIRRAQEGA